MKLASKFIPNLNDKLPAKERRDRLVELKKPLHRALKHAKSDFNNVQKAGAPHKTAKKVVAEIQGVLRVLKKQFINLFFGATFGWDKLGNALNHSHLPSSHLSSRKFAKKLGVKAGDVSMAPVPFLPKRRPPFTTQTLTTPCLSNIIMHHSIRPLLFSNIFLCRPPLHPLMFMVMREGIVAAHLTRLVHTHMVTTNLLQTVSVGQVTTAAIILTALHAN